MGWRVHLTNQAIPQLDILPGSDPFLAVWTRRNRVAFYHLETGTAHGENHFDPPVSAERTGEAWQAFVGSLCAPTGVYLPVVRFNGTTLYSTDDGRMRLYHTGGADLYLETEGKEVKLPVKPAQDNGDAAAEPPAIVSVSMDGALGIVAALDENGHLHIYQQNIPVGAVDIGLKPEVGLPLQVVAAHAGTIFATDGQQLLVVNSAGKVQQRLPLYYYLGKLSCSPGAGYVATGDIETGVIRVYRGKDLTLTHQRFGIDMIAAATQVQLLADIPPLKVGLSALAVYNKGLVAFAMSGVVCVVALEDMDEVPRPQPLL